MIKSGVNPSITHKVIDETSSEASFGTPYEKVRKIDEKWVGALDPLFYVI